jgi:hypothetical protein
MDTPPPPPPGVPQPESLKLNDFFIFALVPRSPPPQFPCLSAPPSGYDARQISIAPPSPPSSNLQQRPMVPLPPCSNLQQLSTGPPPVDAKEKFVGFYFMVS